MSYRTASSVLKKFADDTKWGFLVQNNHDRMTIQQGLDNLMDWSLEWQMLFNVEKCHIIHVGRNNGFQYSMNGRILDKVESEKDVGALLHNLFRHSIHRVAAKATLTLTQVLGLTFLNTRRVKSPLGQHLVQ